MRSLISITDIANSVCEEVGDVTYKSRRNVMRSIARCYKKLHIFLTPVVSIKTEVFPIAGVIEMPNDFIYETKVGLKIGDEIKLIGKNYSQNGNGIMANMSHSEFDNYLTDPIGVDIDRDFTPFYNYKGELVLNAHGQGGCCKGLYTVNTAKGHINIGYDIPNQYELVVEYKSDGISEGLDLVPTEMESCLYNYGLARYFFFKNDPRYAVSNQEYEEDRYQLEVLYTFSPINYLSKLYDEFDKGTINDFI